MPKKMKRDELVSFLARCVATRISTEADAVLVLKKFDAGTLPDLDLPIPPEQFITGLSRAMIDEALE